MPKKSKVLTRTLYTYVRPVNSQWVRHNYKKNGFTSYSDFLDTLISVARLGGIRLKRQAQKTT